MGKTAKQDNSVAIIGMGCVFPKANGLDEYWQLLFNGKDAIEDIPEETHFAIKDYFDKDPKCPDHIYCKRGGFIPAVSFDPSKYGIPPNNLNATDTSQLLGLVVAEMALKDAGYNVKDHFPNKKRTNIILGVTGTQELVIPLGARLSHPLWKNALKDSGIDEKKSDEVIKRIQNGYPEWQENSFPGLLGNVVAGRIANKLDLGGTNSVVDAACASSLAAINNAVMELVQDKCDMSVTGGVDTLNDIFMHMCFSQTGVLSHSSDAKPFSKDADGTVLGEGVGMIVLKRLKDAQKDNDRIYAVIKGIGTSSDGNSGGIYAPDADGQQRALNAAYKEAGIDPLTIESIEAHGTGTRVGDKIEFTALKNFRKTLKSKSDNSCNVKCAVGSVKSMIGHAKAAAGIAGLIKTALSLYHKTHFPSLKAEEPDPELDIRESHFYINSSSKPWIKTNHKENTCPRRAGVSAFGFGGSNFHAVLEEYNNVKEHVSWSKSVQILAFSGKSIKELETQISDMKTILTDDEKHDSKGKRDRLAFYASKSRKNFSNQHEFRLTAVIENNDDPVGILGNALQLIGPEIKEKKPSLKNKNIYFQSETPKRQNKDCKIGFLFPGQGSQYTTMGRDLISIFPEAIDALALADDWSAQGGSLDRPLHDYIYPLPGYAKKEGNAEDELRSTDIAQPALGAISLAMLRILKRFSVTPGSACGHSFGELCALNAAGRIDDNDLLKLAAARGRYMARASEQSEDSGSMFAVKASMDKIEAVIKENNLDVILANRNSYSQGVLSGTTEEIDRAVKILKKNKIRGIKLPVAAAFHSRLVENAAKPFAEDLKTINFNETDIPVMSNTTGSEYPADNKKAKSLLGSQLSNPVNFIKNIESMYENGTSIFLEIGPKTVLTGLVKSILKDKNITALSMDISGSKNKPDAGLSDLAHVLADLASKGCNVDLTEWEEPCTDFEEKKMNVFIKGANPKPVAKYDLPPSKPVEKNQGISNDTIHAKSDKKEISEPQEVKNMQEKTNVEKSAVPIETPQKPVVTNEAVALLQKGLESIQKLQSQTAKTHEKFLETQAEASRALQSMMEQTRSYTGRAPVTPETAIEMQPAPDVSPAVTYEAPVIEPVKGDTGRNERQSGPDTDTAVEKKPEEKTVAAHETKAATDNAATDKGINEKTEGLVFEIVSKLTGFPVEMLEADMDIESDLGIDSIKRVEIISELEKNLPAVSSLTPENMGTLRTLKEICDTIDANADPEQQDHDTSADKAPEKLETSTGETNSMDVLIRTISSLTGFPVEMLEQDMDLESDLGIDSIKRVEILSTLEKELPDIGTLSSDKIAELKTIKEIGSYLDENLGQTEKPENNQESVAGNRESVKKKTPGSIKSKKGEKPDKAKPLQKLSRQIPFIEKQPVDKIKFYNGSRLVISGSKKVYLTEDETGIAKSFKKEFEKQGIRACLVKISKDNIPDLPDAAGIVITPDISGTVDNENTTDFLKNAFALAKKNGPYLMASAKEKSAFFATVSFLGGDFGFENKDIKNPFQGGLAGLSKTADLEWKDVLCKAIDMPWSEKEIIQNAENAVTLMMTHGSVEMGISEGMCNIPRLRSEDLFSCAEPDCQTAGLADDDVFVISGGAKGVTAECAIKIADTFSLKIMLLGRSACPSPDPDWMTGLSSKQEIKKAILYNMFTGKTPKPVELEKAYKKMMSNREIEDTIRKIQDAGSDVEYFPCDILKADQVETVFKTIRKKHGKITGIVHGAGILEDKLIIEKDYEKFCNVFDTKVSGLNNLLKASRKDKLKYFIGFSSVAARTGNTGQSDYSMANEILNKTLAKLSFENPECKYLALNWGPWDGGMVDESLKKEFQKRKVDLIDKKAGAAHLASEIISENRNDVEIILGAGLFGKQDEPKKSKNKAFDYTLDGGNSPVLDSHRINHTMVVPFAIHMEWLAHAAEKNNPGLHFTGLDNMRLLKGISLEKTDSITISTESGKCKKTEQGFETEVNVLSVGKNETSFINSEGTAILDNFLPDAPVLSTASFLELAPCTLSADDVYKSVLFHGKDLQAIKSIKGCSPKGIEVTASRAPGPDKWLNNHPGRRWLFDPLLLDAAFQAAILWTWENKQQVGLPSYIANFRLYNSFAESEGDVTIRFTVNEIGRHRIRGYFTFIDENDRIIASITGFEAINDPSLIKKFRASRELISKNKLLAFTQGNPSEAFGDRYKAFDHERKMARLPRPPYFFMDRVTQINHTQWEMQPGGWIEAEYDLKPDDWFFNANKSDTIPFCILLEIALQPCGWLAAWAGSALQSDERLYFRNLGGKANIIENIARNTGTVTIRSKMTNVSQAGGMIIQDFDFKVLKNTALLYEGSTNFGFFTEKALSNQTGIKESGLSSYQIDQKLLEKRKETAFQGTAPLTPDDSNMDGNTGMPARALLMSDRIEKFSFKGGLYNNGYIKAVKEIDPEEWFFKAHFYQDPVCPGSLGIESFLQLLRFFALEKWNFDPEEFRVAETKDTSHEWKYRGQITPLNKEVEVCAHIKEIIDGDQPSIIADGALSVDGMCIYEMLDFNVSLIKNITGKKPESKDSEKTRI